MQSNYISQLWSIAERFFTVMVALFSATPIQSGRMHTALEVLKGYNSLSVEEILRPFDDDNFSHQVLPLSLGMPLRSKSEFAKHAMGITSVFERFRMEPKQAFEDEVQNSVIIYARMIGDLMSGMGQWENECIMIMKFSSDERKVVSIQEFVDSAKAKAMQEQMRPDNF